MFWEENSIYDVKAYLLRREMIAFAP